jgi:SAM-dependent methyltransferase
MDAELIRRQSALEERHWWFRARAEIVRGLVPPGDPERELLDVGCGWGGLTRHLVGLGRVRGVEPSEVAREEAARRGLEVLDGSAEVIPVPDATIDVAVVTDVLEHLDDDARALRELHRTLRPGGVAVITVPAYGWLFSSHDRALDHRRRYGKRQLLRRVREAGLEPERVTHYNTLLFPPIALVRLATRNRPPSEDARPTWGPLNALLYRLFSCERALMDRRPLPFGLSLAVVARRPA